MSVAATLPKEGHNIVYSRNDRITCTDVYTSPWQKELVLPKHMIYKIAPCQSLSVWCRVSVSLHRKDDAYHIMMFVFTLGFTYALFHDDVIKWKHFLRYWPFVWGIHRWSVNSLHKCQWRGASMFSLIYARINGLENNGEAGDLSRHRAHYDVTVMSYVPCKAIQQISLRYQYFGCHIFELISN